MNEKDYRSLVDELSAQPDSVAAVADSVVRLFPVDGAAVSTLGAFLGNGTVSSSDPFAARIDELQFDLGEGPCWDALRTTQPVFEADLRGRQGRVWPSFSTAVEDRVGAIFAFPMIVGPLRIGAMDMYASNPVELDRTQAARAVQLAGLVGRNILRLAIAEAGENPGATRVARRSIHQATGMVLAQLDISAEEAGLVIQGHAFATNRPMSDVAEDVLAGRLVFRRGADGIEEAP